MEQKFLKDLLQQVADGKITVDDALLKFKKEPFTYSEYLDILSKLTPLKEKAQFWCAKFEYYILLIICMTPHSLLDGAI